MKSMKIPTRPAPSIEEAIRKQNLNQRPVNQPMKKKPPPRPPPPNFTKTKSKSAWNILQPFEETSLIDLSPPDSPKNFVASRNRAFGGSISSSYSSSTSSLASSKKSFEYETVNIDPWATPPPNSGSASQSTFYVATSSSSQPGQFVPPMVVPTIIRAQPQKRNAIKIGNQREISPPMPAIPPPSPPKDVVDIPVPCGIALYDFIGTHQDDLSLQENDVVYLLKKVDNEWYYGRVDDREGMFPASFIDIQVPLPENDRVVTALYEFEPQVAGDLELKPGQLVYVTSRLSADWLVGESNGMKGQFPANFVDRIPESL